MLDVHPVRVVGGFSRGVLSTVVCRLLAHFWAALAHPFCVSIRGELLHAVPNIREQGQKSPRQGQDIPQLFHLEDVLSRKSQFGCTNVGHEADRPVARDHVVNQLPVSMYC